MKKFNFHNQGQGLTLIIIVLALVALIGGGAYYYYSKQIQKAPESHEKPVEEKVIKPEEKESKILANYPDFCSAYSWSPNKKYLIIDCGTSPERVRYVHDGATGEKVMSFYAFGSSFWLSDEEIVFTEPQPVSPARPYGSGWGSGISICDLAKREKKVLKSATALKDYGVEGIENDKIKFSLIEVSSPQDWGAEGKEKITHWIMDKYGNVIE